MLMCALCQSGYYSLFLYHNSKVAVSSAFMTTKARPAALCRFGEIIFVILWPLVSLKCANVIFYAQHTE
ncbi:hypothetical protein CKQ54_09085 [Rahnella variigena]|uniref:Uncharacterized protein n=1 Tax=Rahnella variigena TaxID=574964 RepID=A0ABX9PTZ8_9GAMM|nr:hypothetical protein CKQ54_09085 [Rahnella variigena]